MDGENLLTVLSVGFCVIGIAMLFWATRFEDKNYEHKQRNR